MKKLLTILMAAAMLLSVCALTACGGATEEAAEEAEAEVEEEAEEVPAPVIPLFDDWKYMGFGTEVPKEVEEAVKAAPVDFIVDGFKVYDAESRNVVILHTSGLNVDQAESKLEISVSKSAAANVPADISLDDSTGVRNQNPVRRSTPSSQSPSTCCSWPSRTG